jgi:hypothetical protein
VKGQFVSADGSMEYSGGWKEGVRHGYGVFYQVSLVAVHAVHAACWAELSSAAHVDKKLQSEEPAMQSCGLDAHACCLPMPQRGAFKYIGQWERDVQHGEGKCTYADGSVYGGNWKDGMR